MSSNLTINAIIGALALVIGPLALKLFNRRDTSYDQIQEDLKEMRIERKNDREAAIEEREKDRISAKENAAASARETRTLKNLVLHLDNEVVKLRNDIQAGNVPPLKPREPWPREAL